MIGSRTRTNGRGCLVWILLAALFASLSAAPAAHAGQGVWITVHNETPAKVDLLSRDGSNCWEGQTLGHQPGEKSVAPKATVTYSSEKKTSRGCGGDAHQNVQLMVQDAGSWLLPQGSPPNYRLFWQDGSNENFGINLYDGLGTWVPREDGKGLLCLHSEIKDANHADIWAYSDRHCNVAVPETIQHSSPKPPPPSLPAPAARTLAAASAGEGEKEKKEKEEEEKKKEEAEYPGVINVLSAVGVACPWFAYPKEPKRCEELNPGDPEKWSIANLSRKVNNFKIKTAAAAKNEKVAVAAVQTSIPPDESPGQLSVNETVGISESNTSTTQRGAKIGVKFGFKQSIKANIPFIGEGGVEFSQELNEEYSWGRTDARTTTQSKQKTVAISTTAKPGFTTHLDVFTARRNANYTYEADLEFGNTEGKPQNVTTPANVALAQSPAWRQPCLGYVVGGPEVRNSLVYIGEALLRAGYRPDDSSLAPEKRALLESVPFYHGGAKACEGFPAGYSSSASFNGTGVGTYANLGYDLSGNPVSKMIGCVYAEPYAGEGASSSRARGAARAERARVQAQAEATVDDSPCREVPVAGGRVEVAEPGVLVDDSGLGGLGAEAGLQGPTSKGTVGSDKILGPRRGGTVRSSGGAFDVIETGSGDTRVLATARENIVEGKEGDDELSGGGRMSYLYGGGGDDGLTDAHGAAVMYGEGGGDTFEGTDMKGAMFGGGGDDKMIGKGDLSQLAMSGGAGSDVYVLKGHGTPSIVQLPGPGQATVLTDHSLTVPPNLDVARAIGPRRVTLRGGEASRLVAGEGGSVLVSGPGPTRLRGRGGPDTIVFDGLNDDSATGAGGADRYVFTGNPETGQRPAGLRYPARPAAPVVSDFESMRGDRLVLRSSVFGPEVLQLRRHFTVVAAARPRPRGARPTLLFDTRSGLLSFDRDGSGPISDQVVVELPRSRGPRPGWFEFRRG